ncbi:class III lanthionine synthetase LanKC [Glycomyces xiaoerkulensis]|uniref:class III lanthionine synthetase LanKC n=1 Tax=Glycomyces xiaoerkulensis TaxID=2038139 RepID=UPI000C25A9D2|nr:class III lanthionine synthetase LanKC [Glycomyces xiaoerkulensis]
MGDHYEKYSMADRTFYDAMHSATSAGPSFAIAERPLPDGWECAEQDDWITVRSHRPLPSQGWKIHASAAAHSAERVLETVWNYCVDHGVQFKFLRSPNALTARLSKYAPRDSSGKLATVYPPDEDACERILHELGALLEGVPGPYILSDLRWGSGPLHVRYGAFADRYTVTDGGDVVPAITDPEGLLVPDIREPVFRTPEWVDLPDFLVPHLKARNEVTVTDLPYEIERVLHFSNGGGIYLARDERSGDQVVLKEGRPHAGIDARSHDAVQRVEHEYDILRRLEGIDGVPRAHELFWLGEHRFMAMEHVDGEVLSSALVDRYPLADPTATPEDYRRFTEWARSTHDRVAGVLEAIHRRGLAYGDLHLFNVIERAEGGICLLDFEVAGPADATRPAGLGNQGFAAPRSMAGAEADRYSLACLKLALFLPLTNLLGLHRPKARHLAAIIRERFPVAADYLDEAVERIAPSGLPAEPAPSIEPDTGRWPALRDRIARSIVASATPERDDRLFPGDIRQFSTGGLGLAFGAAGVLYALAACGAGRWERFERWLLDRSLAPPPGTRLGLYDGLHGAAFTLDHLGHRQAALDIVDLFLDERWETLSADLDGGLAGAGLNLLHLARTADGDETELRETGLRCAELVAERVPFEAVGEVSGGDGAYAGLMRGGAGRSLLLMRAYDETGDGAYLDAAEAAIELDLRRCTVRGNGSMEVDEGWRTMPYLEVGAAGVGIALDAFAARRRSESFAAASDRIARAAESPMYILPGLFTGRAGMLLYRAGRSAEPLADPVVRDQVRALSWHALPYEGGVAFPGTGLLRLSMDLATGGAGVLLALGSVLRSDPVAMPLLPASWPASPQASAPTAPMKKRFP